MRSFPKILTLGQKYTEGIFDGYVEITEKVDGSQFGFGKINGELFVRSKGCLIDIENPNDMFKQGVQYVKSISERLPDNTLFHGEYLQTPKHNTLVYTKIPKNHICLFSVSFPDDTFVSHGQIKQWADLLGIDCVPLLYSGTISDINKIPEMIESESYLGGAKMEGVVIKNYDKTVMIGGQVIPLMSAKFVSDDFKEVHQSNWKQENTKSGKIDTYKMQFKSEARFEKAVQFLRDSGQLEFEPRDIPKVLERVNRDILEEEKENIKDFLWGIYGKEILATATKGLPEWYKNKLLALTNKE
jgi:hypothetical protein